MKHNGSTPYSSDSTFQYYRTVLSYGADNTGTRDSSDAFNRAIADGNRTANTVTTRPAYIYVEPGTYLISASIQMLVSTFLVGDPLNVPTLVAHHDLGSRPVIIGYDEYQGDLGATKNFYMTVRNLRIDTRAIPSQTIAVAMDWSVSQGCSLSNIDISMLESSSHVGITMNNGGSGTLIADSVSA